MPADGTFKDKIALIFTERYQNVKMDIDCLKQFKDKMIFFGLPREHNLFEKRHFKVDYIPVNDALEFARYAKGCKCVVGNQSGLFSIAEEVKANRILLPVQFMNYQRNGQNFVIPGPCNNVCVGGWWENASTAEKLESLVKELI